MMDTIALSTYMGNKYVVYFDSFIMGSLIGIGSATIIGWFGGDAPFMITVGVLFGGYSGWAQYKNMVAVANAKSLLAKGGK